MNSTHNTITLPCGIILSFKDYCESCNECDIEIRKGISNINFISCIHEDACERIYKMKEGEPNDSM